LFKRECFSFGFSSFTISKWSFQMLLKWGAHLSPLSPLKILLSMFLFLSFNFPLC
jgi:hypothetical protein